jgi:Pentapeptide repeats (8 copies)
MRNPTSLRAISGLAGSRRLQPSLQCRASQEREGSVMKEMTAEELLERYAAGERGFAGVKLIGGSLCGANLSGYSGDKRIYFQGSDFSHANLIAVDFSHAYLADANFSYADLRGARLHFADFSGANLTGANLRCAHLIGARFEYANLTDANLWGAVCDGTSFGNANLTETNFYWSTMIETNFRGATANGNCDDVHVPRHRTFYCDVVMPYGDTMEGPYHRGC